MIASLGTKVFFNFSQNLNRNQDIFTVFFVVIAIDSFCSSFWHQEKLNSPHIFLWRTGSCES